MKQSNNGCFNLPEYYQNEVYNSPPLGLFFYWGKGELQYNKTIASSISHNTIIYNIRVDKEIKKKLDNFFFSYKSLSFKKRDVLIRGDKEPEGIFYLKKGYVRQYTVSSTGKEKSVNIFKNPSFFPMIWALAEVENNYYYEAMSDVQVA